jgi:hypothetical protein
MKRRRGIPAITFCAVLLFAGNVVIWMVTLFVTSPAANYANAPACTAGTSVPSGCRTTVAATVSAAGHYTQSRGTGYWVMLSGPGVPTRSQTGTNGDWGAMNLTEGQHVTVALWAGAVVSVASGRYVAFTYGNPPQDRYSLVWISLFFLVAALALGRVYRDPLLGGRWSGRLRLADIAVVPALFAATLAFFLHRGLISFAAIVFAGTAAGLVYLPAMAWNRREPVLPPDYQRRRAEQRWRRSAQQRQSETGAQAAACPVDESRRVWIERSMRWFVREFGEYAARGEVAIPAPEFYPAGYAARPEQIRELFERVCALMYVKPGRVHLVLRDGGRAWSNRDPRFVGRFRAARFGRDRIELDLAEAADPCVLTAVLAHELGHRRLLGEGRVSTRRRDHELLADLVTVFFGLGLFSAGAAVPHRKSTEGWATFPLTGVTISMVTEAGDERHLGYLDGREYGYALACWARLRGESNPLWIHHLAPDVRTTMTQGLAYLERTGRTTAEV